MEPKITIIDAITGEQEIRPMNEAELAIYNQDKEAAAARLADEQAKATAKAALLDRLGITADEAALLLG